MPKQNNGILVIPRPQIRIVIPNDVEEKIVSFYRNDTVSRVCPSKKDYVSVKTDDVKEHVQKHLLLGNLKKLYVNFHEENSDLRKVGFSTFCTFRLQECVMVNNSESHIICVCPHHQSAKIMVTAVNKSLYYADLMTLLVCDITNEECMLK